MRKLSLFIVLAVAVVFAAVGFAIDVKSGSQCVAVIPGTTSQAVAVASSPMALPNAYTIYSGDSSADIFLKREYAGVAETYWIKIPAGNSLLIPAPTPEASGSSWQQVISFQAHGDTIYVLPWFQ